MAASEDVRALLLEGFEGVETLLGLGAHRIDGIPWWDLVRYPFHQTLVEAVTERRSEDAVEPPSLSFAALFRIARNVLLSATTRAPTRAHRGGVLFLGHPRRRRIDGVYTDLYVDPLLDLLDDSVPVDVLEEPIDFGHRRPARTARLWYLDLLHLRGRLAFRSAPGLPEDRVGEVLDIEAAFREATGADVPLVPFVDRAIRRWRAFFPLYEALLRRLRPRSILLVRSARREIFVAAARACGIPTAELQHGSPARGKLNYDYGSGVGKSLFPDVFAAFGRYWVEEVALPLPRERVACLGYPYLTSVVHRYSRVEKRDQIVAISQPDVHGALVDFCVELASRLPEAISCVFKPHPAEVGRRDFSRLRRSGWAVLDDPDSDLYELLAESRWQIGVYSTALYEGLAFGCACFVLRTAGHELMQRLVTEGLACFVEHPEEVDLSFSVDDAAARKVFEATTPQRIRHLLEMLEDPSAPSSRSRVEGAR